MSNDTNNTRFSSINVYVQSSEIHGRGVFTNKLLNKDEIIEVFPLVPLAFRTRYQGDFGLFAYSFINDACPCEECKRHGNVIYLGMGYSSVYNHQDEPNAEMIIDFNALTGTVKAISNIEKDSEIFIKYKNEELFSQGKVTRHAKNNS